MELIYQLFDVMPRVKKKIDLGWIQGDVVHASWGCLLHKISPAETHHFTTNSRSLSSSFFERKRRGAVRATSIARLPGHPPLAVAYTPSPAPLSSLFRPTPHPFSLARVSGRLHRPASAPLGLGFSAAGPLGHRSPVPPEETTA